MAKLPKEIKDSNTKGYNVILVRKTHDAANEEYKIKIVVATYNSRGYNRAKKNYMYLGFSSFILLHDPSLEKQDSVLERHQKSQIELEAEKQLKEKHENEKKELIAKLEKEKLKEIDTIPEKVDTEGTGVLKGIDVGFSVPDAKIEVIMDFVKENKIDLKGEKDETKIRKILTDWLIETKK